VVCRHHRNSPSVPAKYGCAWRKGAAAEANLRLTPGSFVTVSRYQEKRKSRRVADRHGTNPGSVKPTEGPCEDASS